MRSISKGQLIATHVLISFEEGAVSLLIPAGATLEDIFEKLARIGRWHRGQALSFDVVFKTSALQNPGRGRPISLCRPTIMSSASLPAANSEGSRSERCARMTF
jgi:hypothetical protein